MSGFGLLNRWIAGSVCLLLGALILTACSRAGSVTPGALPASAAATAGKQSPLAPATPPVTASSGTGGTTSPGGSVTIAFGGDVHFAGSAAAGLSGDLGTAMPKLAGADISMVNLETAITARGTAAPKQYTFRAPPTAMSVLRRAGVDVVTVANNHGMDYGQVGLSDTLAASRRYRLPVIGAGNNVTAAYRPYTKTVHGVRVAILAATDVLDTFAKSTWPATDTQPGLAATTTDPSRLLAAVRAAATKADVVVVDLHWGVELQRCPTPRQLQLRQQLIGAGADVVVGSHAHVVEPMARHGRTAVAFGLGNFVFYARSGATLESGVYTVTVDRRGVLGAKWAPARISGGRPQLLTGSAATAARNGLTTLARTCAAT